jgi:hypothetical protein
MTLFVESAIQIATLATVIWVVRSQWPRARHEQDAFVAICTVVTGLLALLVFLFLGIGMHSR